MYQKYIRKVSHCAVDAGNEHRTSRTTAKSKFGLLSKSIFFCILLVYVSTVLSLYCILGANY